MRKFSRGDRVVVARPENSGCSAAQQDRGETGTIKYYSAWLGYYIVEMDNLEIHGFWSGRELDHEEGRCLDGNYG